MIFVTVGHQIPFDRLIRAVDAWAGETGRTDVFAQIGTTAYRPQYIEYKDKIDPIEFRQLMAEADLIVSHAGTGTILTALEVGTSILVMPRLGRLMETRNDHQVATAKRFQELKQVVVAQNERELVRMLGKVEHVKINEPISCSASSELIKAISSFIYAFDSIDR